MSEEEEEKNTVCQSDEAGYTVKLTMAECTLIVIELHDRREGLEGPTTLFKCRPLGV